MASVPGSVPQLPSSAEMALRQNSDDALRLLIAQRRLYSRAKRWLGARWFGMLVIGLAAPVVSVLWPNLAVVSGAVAGVWIFTGRTILSHAQSAGVAKGAATQELFDFLIFGMSGSIRRSTLPSPEDISAIAGPDSGLRATAGRENLFDWYHIEAANPSVVTVALSQRSNAVYSDRLLRTTLIVWSGVVVAWITALVGLTVAYQLSLLEFAVGIALPVLPALLDISQYIMSIAQAVPDRRDLANSITDSLAAKGGKIEVDDLLVWQERMYGLRCSTPDVPDLIYKIRRKVNERVMRSAASQLAKDVRDQEQ